MQFLTYFYIKNNHVIEYELQSNEHRSMNREYYSISKVYFYTMKDNDIIQQRSERITDNLYKYDSHIEEEDFFLFGYNVNFYQFFYDNNKQHFHAELKEYIEEIITILPKSPPIYLPKIFYQVFQKEFKIVHDWDEKGGLKYILEIYNKKVDDENTILKQLQEGVFCYIDKDNNSYVYAPKIAISVEKNSYVTLTFNHMDIDIFYTISNDGKLQLYGNPVNMLKVFKHIISGESILHDDFVLRTDLVNLLFFNDIKFPIQYYYDNHYSNNIDFLKLCGKDLVDISNSSFLSIDIRNEILKNYAKIILLSKNDVSIRANIENKSDKVKVVGYQLVGK